MARTTSERGWNKRTVSRLAWRETKATEDAHKRLGVERRASEDPWDSFVEIDLGFGLLQGPNILATMFDLEEINRRNAETLHGPKRRSKLKAKRTVRVTGKRARRAIHQMLRLRRSA